MEVLIFGLMSMAVGAALLWKAGSNQLKEAEDYEKNLIRQYVNSVKDKIGEVLLENPDIPDDATIEAFNDDKDFDLGTIFYGQKEITFPVEIPEDCRKEKNVVSNDLALPPNSVSLRVSGTVSKFQIEGLSKFSNSFSYMKSKKTYKIVYSSHLDSSIEGMIYPSR